MRLLTCVLSLAILGIAARAEATTCGDRTAPWWDPYATPLYSEDQPLPIDGQPWQFVDCSSEGVAIGACEFVDAEGLRTPVEVEDVGVELCELRYGAGVRETASSFIRRFVPPAPLVPGAYTLECEGRGSGSFEIRETDTPAAPPTPLVFTDTHLTRGDDGGCCGGFGDVVELRVADDLPYLHEGGYVEVKYPNGQHLALTRAEDGQFVLPWDQVVIELTPVSASGARGETVVLDLAEVDGDLAYVPCDVAGRRPSAALWLLAPLAWLYTQGRRRRRCA
ncbi:MAG TPA: hypothetical protein VGB85_16640 [Nannocystis sp.]|jgi:hypothetical protein